MKNYFSKLFIITILLVGLFHSCSKNKEHNEFNDKKIDSIFEENFVPKQFLKKSSENPEVLLMLVDSLRKINDNNTFAKQFINSFGVPDFLNSDVFIVNDNVTVLTPIIKNENVNSIIISSFLDNMFHYYVTTREFIPIPNLYVAQIIDTVNIENNQALFDAYEYQLFQNESVRFRFKNKYGTIDYNKSFAELWNTKKVLQLGEGVCVEFYNGGDYMMMCEYGGDSGGSNVTPSDNNGGVGDSSNYDQNTGTGNTGGGSSSTGGSVNNLNPTTVDDILISNEIADNICVSDIIYSLGYNCEYQGMVPDITEVWNLSNFVLQLLIDANDVTLNIIADDLSNAYGNTDPTINNGEFTLRLDRDLLKNGTKLGIAKTIIHESIHAYLVYKTRMDPTSGIVSLLKEYYEVYNHVTNLTHHNFMVQYVDAFAYSLKVYDNNNQTMDYYTKLAWSGLYSSDAFKNKSISEQNEIRQIVKNESEGLSGAKSSKCESGRTKPIE